jgi:hypothetical protein
MKGKIISMTSTGFSRSMKVLLALLLCHGVFGALHLCPSSQASASHVHEYHSPADTGAGIHEHAVCHLMDAAHYFAVFLVAVLGLVLGLLLRGARLWGRVSAPLAFYRRLKPYISHPPRGPTLPVLQVFRL